MILSVRDLCRSFVDPSGGAQLVIDIPSFSLDSGQQVGLAGPSGSGKTTFLHLLAGILRADSGSIALGGTELVGASEATRDRVRAEQLGYVFQTFNLLQGFSVLENLELAMRFGRGWDAAHARNLLAQVGLSDRLHHKPAQLSVGQQQRVAVARALANRPQVVLADEPTGNLDPSRAQEALALLREVCTEQGAALLVVSHDEAVLSAFDTRLSLAELNRAGAAA